MKKIKDHFKINDPLLYSYLTRVTISQLKPATDLFEQLCSSIIGQQLSGKAADTIFARFKKLFSQNKFTASALIRIPDREIRSAGCSWAKVASLKNLASRIMKGDLQLDDLWNLSDKQVIHELVKVKGIGPWTAEMFLIFALAREDVFSHTDLGLNKALEKLYKLKKPTTRNQIDAIVLKWKPYRTYAAMILWKSLEI